jgi:hypothetical protein
MHVHDVSNVCQYDIRASSGAIQLEKGETVLQSLLEESMCVRECVHIHTCMHTDRQTDKHIYAKVLMPAIYVCVPGSRGWAGVDQNHGADRVPKVPFGSSQYGEAHVRAVF